MYGLLIVEQVGIFSSVHRVHLLLPLLQRGPWSEIFNKGDKVPRDTFFWRNVLDYSSASATVNQPFPVSCSTLETHLSGPRLAPWLWQRACFQPSAAGCLRLLTSQARCDWSPHRPAPADTQTLGAKHKRKGFGVCMSLPTCPSRAAPLPSSLPVHGVSITG